MSALGSRFGARRPGAQLPLLPPTIEVCQRWRLGRDQYRRRGETFDPSRFDVRPIEEREARVFVTTHHYSRSYPAARCRIGLFHKPAMQAEALCGVAVFSVPINNGTVPKYTGVAAARGVELGRFVLLDWVPGNAESWLLGRAFRLLVQQLPQVCALVSYSDPVERHDETGNVILPGHVGTIYQACNGRYLGRSRARALVFSRDGRVLSERTMTKLKNGEKGADYAYRTLLGMGAPARGLHEPMDRYIERALREGGFRREHHPGNHVYAWAVGDRRARHEVSFPQALPYPKKHATLPLAA